ncbi:hypothetical protein P1P68_26700 [Streptomyces scabiei]|uniref:hypothetical protein n=1 Tax=Streptomyces scabiei TaxID=1930 RepID=UPI00298F41B6|nr:hypothetical protein [Streptomyces scabiei]MDW8808278.1 hypothetical protein [Streptomyces scabiei]
MRTSVAKISAAGAAAVALISVPTTAFAASDGAIERPASSVAGHAFQKALAERTVVSTQDYCEPGANTPGRCH